MNAFRDQLLDDGRSPDMVKRVLSSLAAIVGEAQARGLVAANNVRAIAKIKRERRAERPEMPSQAELQAIIAATPDRHRPLILTALLAGLRGSELRGLLWEDVDLAARRRSTSAGGLTGSASSDRRSRKPGRAPSR